MSITWKKSFRPEHVLSRLSAARTKSASGPGSSFNGTALHYALPSLHSMLKFPPAARHMDHAALIWKAVAYDPGDLTRDSFLKELNRQLTMVMSEKEEYFCVLTSLSIDHHRNLGSTTIDGVRIKFAGHAFPSKFVNPRAELVKKQHIPVSEIPTTYTKVVATLKARNASQAFSQARDAVDLFRSLWCLLLNTDMEIFGSSWHPINSVRLGSIHTVHTQAGTAASESFWFEPYHAEMSPNRPKDTAAVKSAIAVYRKRLKECPYRDALAASLLLYVRALDEWNQTTAFVRLWSAIERLTSPEVANYDLVVRRCAWLWTDVDFAIQTLEHLRAYRNGFMHAGSESPQAKTYCFQLQQYYRALLRFHIGNSGKFSSLDEANSILDMPADHSVLVRLKKQVTLAQKYRTPKTR